MSTSPVPPGIEDVYPLTPMQSALLFHSEVAPGTGAYREQVVCNWHEPLDIEILQRSWNVAVSRHAALRTVLRLDGNAGPVQQVQRHAKFQVAVLDWSDLSPGWQAACWESFLAEDLRQDFDRTHVPMRWSLILLSPDRSRLLWTFHHALLDGKVDRRSLPKANLANQTETEEIAPRNDTEQRLVSLWRELLKHDPRSLDESFLDAGGHSLLAMQLVGRIEAVFGRKLPLATLFQHGTIRELARILDESNAVKENPPTPDPESRPRRRSLKIEPSAHRRR